MPVAESFNWIRYNDCQEFRLSPDKKTEVLCYFTNLRVDRDTLPKGWYAYDIMGTDSGSIGGGIIKDSVMINHVGTLLTKQKIKMTHLTKNHFGTIISRYRGVGPYTFGFGDRGPYDPKLYYKLEKEIDKILNDRLGTSRPADKVKEIVLEALR